MYCPPFEVIQYIPTTKATPTLKDKERLEASSTSLEKGRTNPTRFASRTLYRELERGAWDPKNAHMILIHVLELIFYTITGQVLGNLC